MFHLVYKTTNIVNNKKYIGIHTTNNLNDKYIGTGLNMLKAVKKYGKAKFSREILQICESREDAINIERDLVNKEVVESEEYYNLALGGGPGVGMHSLETRSLLSQKLKNHFANNPKVVSDATRDKMRVVAKHRIHKKYVCEYCGKNITKTNYKKWHGIKCKECPDRVINTHECAHCSVISVNKTNITRWHNNNCKYKE